MMLLNCGVGEDSWESLGLQGNQTSQLERKSVLNMHWTDWWWSWNSNILAPDSKSQLMGKDPDAGKDWGQEERGASEDEMVGWHPWLNGHEFYQAPGDTKGQVSLVCCSPRGHKSVHDLATEPQQQSTSVIVPGPRTWGRGQAYKDSWNWHLELCANKRIYS